MDQLEKRHKLRIESAGLTEAVEWMAEKGEIGLFADYLQGTLQTLSNRDLRNFDEKYLKVIILTLLNKDGTYIINSEFETENGYADLLLTRDVRYEQFTNFEWLLEIKFLKEEERSRFEDVKTKGLEQLARYGERDKIRFGFKGDKIKKILLVVVGKNEVRYFEI